MQNQQNSIWPQASTKNMVYDHIDQWLQQHGLTRSASDPNLYFKKIDGKIIILLLYVDDLLIIDDHTEEIADPKQKLQSGLRCPTWMKQTTIWELKSIARLKVSSSTNVVISKNCFKDLTCLIVILASCRLIPNYNFRRIHK